MDLLDGVRLEIVVGSYLSVDVESVGIDGSCVVTLLLFRLFLAFSLTHLNYNQ